MKQKISITIDKEVIKLIENTLKDTKFRNRSHMIEHAIVKILIKNDPKQVN